MTSTAIPDYSPSAWKALPPLLLAVATTIAALGSMALGEPLLLCVALAVLGLALAIRLPGNWVTPAVLFVVYSNLLVVGVKFHGVPSIAAAAIPSLLAIQVAWYVVVRREPIAIGPALPWILGFAVVQLLGAVLAKHPDAAWDSFVTYLLEGVCLYILITNTVRTRRTLHRSVWALLLAGCLMGGVPLFQQVTGTFDNNYGGLAQANEPGFHTGELTASGEVTQKRLSGPIGEKNRYAQIMLMLVPLALYRLGLERSRVLKLLASVAIGFAVAGAVLAFSRTAVLAVGMTLVIAACLGYVGRSKTALALVAVLLALLCMPEYRVRLASLAEFGSLVTSGRHSPADGALKGRATEMGAAALVLLDHPIIGVGPGMFEHYSQKYGDRIGIRALSPNRQAHSLPLGVAAENGLLGLACLLAIFGVSAFYLMRAGSRKRNGDPESAGTARSFLLVLVVYFTFGLFLHFAFIRYFWLMVALADCAAVVGNESQHRGVDGSPSEPSTPQLSSIGAR